MTDINFKDIIFTEGTMVLVINNNGDKKFGVIEKIEVIQTSPYMKDLCCYYIEKLNYKIKFDDNTIETYDYNKVMKIIKYK